MQAGRLSARVLGERAAKVGGLGLQGLGMLICGARLRRGEITMLRPPWLNNWVCLGL